MLPTAADTRALGARPWSMTLVDGRPLYRHVLDRLTAAGVREVAVCFGPYSEAVRDDLLAGLSVGTDASAEAAADTLTTADGLRLHLGPAQGGTGERWSWALDRIGLRRVLLVHANAWSDINPSELLAAHQAAARPITVALTETSTMVLALDQAIRIVSEYRPGLFNTRVEAGMSVVEPEMFDTLRRPATFSRDLLLGAREQIHFHQHDGVCQTVNTAREATLLLALAREHPGLFGEP